MKNKTKIEWKDNKGLLFENIVGILLKNMFPEKTFMHTQYVHDGGKDFYTVTGNSDDEIWVEAKNYENHLELSKFSNTFIMADINEINRIIIFSMTPLTENARLNVARYAAYNHKSISVYAGDDLLSLLKTYEAEIDFDKYFNSPAIAKQEINKATNKNNPEDLITVCCEYFKSEQFNLAYRRDSKNQVNVKKIKQLPLFSTFAQEIILTNKDLLNEKTVTLTDTWQNNKYFEFYFPQGFTNKVVLPPSSTVIVVVFFKLTSYSDKLRLPIPAFKEKVNNIILPYEAECCWLGEIPLIGDAYIKLNEFNNQLENGLPTNFMFVHGVSGVGKTRFIRETAAALYKQGYRVISLDFRNLNQLGIKSVLRKLISNIFVIDNETNEDAVYKKELNSLNKVFYGIMYDDDYDYVKNTTKICTMFCELFEKNKIALLLDNLQDIDSLATSFFIQLSDIVLGNKLINSFFLFCFNEEFLHREKASLKLFNYLSCLNEKINIPLTNFSEKDAVLYLKECLDFENKRPDLIDYFNQIVKKFNTNPFILKQLILYLKQRNVINFAFSSVYISDYSEMMTVLNEIPKGIEKVLECRFEYAIKEFGDRSAFNKIVWCILFLEGLSYGLIEKLDFNNKAVNLLVNYGFIEYNEKNKLIFSHQLIEKFFCLQLSEVRYCPTPILSYLNDTDFLHRVLDLISKNYHLDYCIQEMMLRNRLDLLSSQNTLLAFKKLQIITPSELLLPLIATTVLEVINKGAISEYSTELLTAYKLCVSAQARFHNLRAAEIMKPIIEVEQLTYQDKKSAAENVMLLFKHYVFLLPLIEKGDFLDWLKTNAAHLGLKNKDYIKFYGWIENRLCKNCCALHNFDEAEKHIKNALTIAEKSNDFSAVAEAEIEYGNITAYYNRKETARHWALCSDNIIKTNQNTAYFKVYELGYGILSNMLLFKTDNLKFKIEELYTYRDKTFLYQKLFIDDIFADYCFIRYAEGEKIDLKETLIPILVRMKRESYMYSPIFVTLATYKLIKAYMLTDKKGNNTDLILNLILELIDNGLFETDKIDYSFMILRDIAEYSASNSKAKTVIAENLPSNCYDEFLRLVESCKESELPSITVLTDKFHKINLLHFNYEF